MAEIVKKPLIVLDEDFRVVSFSTSFAKMFNSSQEESMGKLLYEVGEKQWDLPEVKKLLEEELPGKTSIEERELELTFPSLGKKRLLIDIQKVLYEELGPKLIIMA